MRKRELLTSALAFVVKENAIASIDIIRLSVVEHDPVSIKFSSS